MVTVCLDDADAARPHIEAAAPDHPSLVDPGHRMDALFGVVNVPSVVWVDEEGTVVRPPEPGWPGYPRTLPAGFGVLPAMGTTKETPEVDQRALLNSGQDRAGYADALRDWVEHGAASRYALSPDEVVARSRPAPPEASQAAAHFELAQHLWQAGRRDLAIPHFTASHRLQPDNWTYRRQAWSLVAQERDGGPLGRFAQGPLAGQESDWPFESDFASDLAQLGEGEYYPRTL